VSFPTDIQHRRAPGLRRWAVRLTLVVTTITVTCLLGEIVLRVAGYRGDFERINTVFDPVYGKVRKNAWNYGFEVDADRAVSLRGQVLQQPKPPNELRVLFVGDSGTEGTHVDLLRTFPLLFGERVAETCPELGLQAVNAGVLGMTNVDELHFLATLLPLAPDVVVLGLFMSNDITFNLRHTAPRREFPARPDYLQTLRYDSALVHFFFGKALALNDRLEWFTSAAQDEWSLVPLEVCLLDANGMHMLDYAAGEVATYLREPSALVEDAFRVTGDVLEQFAQLGREHGFRFTVLLIPSPSRIAGELRLLHYPDIWTRLARQGIDVAPADLDVDAPTRRIVALCEERGITCIDPSDDLRGAGMHVFFPDDEHLTELGHAVVADVLFARRDEILGTQ